MTLSEDYFEIIKEIVNKKKVPLSMLDSFILLRFNNKYHKDKFNESFEYNAEKKINSILDFWEEKFKNQYDDYIDNIITVSYTHLDVYKRQHLSNA